VLGCGNRSWTNDSELTGLPIAAANSEHQTLYFERVGGNAGATLFASLE